MSVTSIDTSEETLHRVSTYGEAINKKQSLPKKIIQDSL